MKSTIFLLFLPFLSVYSRPRPHIPGLGNSLDLGKGSWRMMKTCVSERRYCTFTVEDERMVGECVEADQVCWNIGYGWLEEEKEDDKNEEVESVESSNNEIVKFPEIISQTFKDVDNQVEEESSFSIDVDIDNLADDMDSKKKGLTSETLEEIIEKEILEFPEAIIQTIKGADNQVEEEASFSVDVDIENLAENSVNNEIVEFQEVIIQTNKDDDNQFEEEVSFFIDIDNLAEDIVSKKKEFNSETIEESIDREILEFPEVIIQTIKDVDNQDEEEASFSVDVDIDNLAEDVESKKEELTSGTVEESLNKAIVGYPEGIIQTIKDVDNQVERESLFSIVVDIDNLADDMDSKKKGLNSETIEESKGKEILEFPDVQTIKDVGNQVEMEAQFSIDVDIDNLAKDMDSKKKELTTEGLIPTLSLTNVEVDLENIEEKGMNVLVPMKTNDVETIKEIDSLEISEDKGDFEAEEEMIKVTKPFEDSVLLEPKVEVLVDINNEINNSDETLESIGIFNVTQPNEIATEGKLYTEVVDSTVTFIDVTEETINYDIETATVEGSRKDTVTIENLIDTAQGSQENIMETSTIRRDGILFSTKNGEETKIAEIKVELDKDLDGEKENTVKDENLNGNITTDEYEEASTKVTTLEDDKSTPAVKNVKNVTQIRTGEENQTDPEVLTEDGENTKQIVVVTTSAELSEPEEGITELPGNASETEIIVLKTSTEASDAQPVQETTPPVFLFNLIKQKFSNP